jgi:putative spermidine/putrescine transport system substrate-binding protein
MTIRTCMGAVMALAAWGAVTPGHGADLTVTAYGGIWEKAVRECFVAAFEKRTGKTAEVVLGGPVQWVNQVAASPQNPPIHILMNQIDNAYDAIDKGIVDKFDASRVPQLANVPARFQELAKGYGTVFDYGAAGLAYNAKTVKNPPKTWTEFVDRTLKGEWHASLPGINYASTPQILIWPMADLYGGSVDNIEPGIQKIKELKASGHVTFWNDVNEFLNQLKSGEIDIGVYWDGRTWAFHDDGNDFAEFINPAPGSVISPVIIQKAKNAPDLAWDYIDTVLSPGPQACFANILQYGVVNEKVEYGEKLRPRITDWHQVRWPPYDKMPSQLSKWVELWNKEIGG